MAIAVPVWLPLGDRLLQLFEFFGSSERSRGVAFEGVGEVAGKEDGHLRGFFISLEFDFANGEVEFASVEGVGEVEIGFEGFAASILPRGGGQEGVDIVAGGIVTSASLVGLSGIREGEETARVDGGGAIVELGQGVDVFLGEVGYFGLEGVCIATQGFEEGHGAGLGDEVDAVGEGDLCHLGGEAGLAGEFPVLGDDATSFEEGGGEEDGVGVGSGYDDREFLDGKGWTHRRGWGGFVSIRGVLFHKFVCMV